MRQEFPLEDQWNVTFRSYIIKRVSAVASTKGEMDTCQVEDRFVFWSVSLLLLFFFFLSHADVRTRVYGRWEERYTLNCELYVHSVGGDSVTEWAGIHFVSRTVLVHVAGALTDMHRISRGDHTAREPQRPSDSACQCQTKCYTC